MQQINQNQSNINPNAKPFPLASEQVCERPYLFDLSDKPNELLFDSRKGHLGCDFSVLVCPFSGCEIFLYEAGGFFCAMFFTPRGKNPALRISFMTEERRIKAVNKFVSAQIAKKERLKQRSDERKNMVVKIKKGDVLYTSCGYEQTNVDYYQVLAVKGKTVSVRSIGRLYESDGHMSGQSTPVVNSFYGDECKYRAVGEYTVKIDSIVNASILEPIAVVEGIPIFNQKYESSYA